MLERLVLRLQSLGMRVFVHIDKRSAGAKEAVVRIRSLGAEAYSWYSIHWGSRSHLGALLRLMRSALLDSHVSYLHTLSGQDYPIRSRDSIESICDGRIFMECEPLHALPAKARDRFEHDWNNSFRTVLGRLTQAFEGARDAVAACPALQGGLSRSAGG